MTEQTETSEPIVEPHLVGIGGWLILPAIGLILGSIVLVVSLIASLAMFSRVADAGYGGLYSLEIVVGLGFLVFYIYAATCFFGKRNNAPATIISLIIASIIASGVLIVIEMCAGAEELAVGWEREIVRDIIVAAIWISYFKVSKRVKATFVNR